MPETWDDEETLTMPYTGPMIEMRLPTLPGEITRFFFAEPMGFDRVTRQMHEYMKKREKLSPADFVLYHVLRGTDWRSVFCPIRNHRKVDAGHLRYHGSAARRTLDALESAADRDDLSRASVFGSFVSPDAYEVIHEIFASSLRSSPLREETDYQFRLPTMPYTLPFPAVLPLSNRIGESLSQRQRNWLVGTILKSRQIALADAEKEVLRLQREISLRTEPAYLQDQFDALIAENNHDIKLLESQLARAGATIDRLRRAPTRDGRSGQITFASDTIT